MSINDCVKKIKVGDELQVSWSSGYLLTKTKGKIFTVKVAIINHKIRDKIPHIWMGSSDPDIEFMVQPNEIGMGENPPIPKGCDNLCCFSFYWFNLHKIIKHSNVQILY
jgi:hypothetical protein